ncbi:MAG: hypothetical protein WD512_15950 [Candidatus Paceibacterota bacterium]
MKIHKHIPSNKPRQVTFNKSPIIRRHIINANAVTTDKTLEINTNIVQVDKIKIAVYSCNIGNYRNEFSNYFNAILDKNIDYFLFTDKTLNNEERSKLSNWNVCNIDALPSDEIMNDNRWTSKYIKFVLPENLKNYDIVIWIDNKMFKPHHKINSMNYDDIVKLLKIKPNTLVFNIKHPDRKTIQEELRKTISLNLENKISGNFFLKYVKNYNSKFILVDTCFIIRKNNLTVNNAFEYCFNLLKKYKLKRDQNVYNYALDQQNIKPFILDDLNDPINMDNKSPNSYARDPAFHL